MSLDGLPTSNLPRQIDHPKCAILKKDTVVLDALFQNYFQELLLGYFICKNCSSGSFESIKSTFTVSRYLKKLPSVLKILFQRGDYDMTTYAATKMNLKLLFLWNL